MKKTNLILIVICNLTITLAMATPGNYQINQACLAVGCFAGDDPNTDTVEIINSGTYILTSNIFVNNSTALSIQPNIDNQIFTVDLNGFQIIQSAISPSIGVNGINIIGSNILASIKNGQIIRFYDGILAQNLNTIIRVENMLFELCEDDAIEAANGIIGYNIFKNNVYGINASNASGALPGDRLYIHNNQFISFSNNQDAIFSAANTNYCKDNMIAYSGQNMDSCTLSGLNLCGSSECTVVLKHTKNETKD